MPDNKDRWEATSDGALYRHVGDGGHVQHIAKVRTAELAQKIAIEHNTYQALQSRVRELEIALSYFALLSGKDGTDMYLIPRERMFYALDLLGGHDAIMERLDNPPES